MIKENDVFPSVCLAREERNFLEKLENDYQKIQPSREKLEDFVLDRVEEREIITRFFIELELGSFPSVNHFEELQVTWYQVGAKFLLEHGVGELKHPLLQNMVESWKQESLKATELSFSFQKIKRDSHLKTRYA